MVFQGDCSDDGQAGGVSGDSVEGVVEFQALMHDLDCAPQDIDISPGIVTSKGGLLKPEATLDVIERMAGPPCFAEEHFRDSNRINRVDLTAGKAVAQTGGLKEPRVETSGIVSDQGGISGPGREIAKHLLGPRRIDDVPISNAGVVFDKRRNATPWLGEAEERVGGAEAARVEFDGCDLDELVVVRVEAGGFEVVDDEGISRVEPIRPNEGMVASGASHPLTDGGFAAAEALVTGWVGALDLHSFWRKPTVWGGVNRIR